MAYFVCTNHSNTPPHHTSPHPTSIPNPNPGPIRHQVGNQVEMKTVEAPKAGEKSAPKKVWYPASVVKVEEKKNLVHVCIPSLKGKHETTVEMICSENICQRGTHLTNRSWQKITA